MQILYTLSQRPTLLINKKLVCFAGRSFALSRKGSDKKGEKRLGFLCGGRKEGGPVA